MTACRPVLTVLLVCALAQWADVCAQEAPHRRMYTAETEVYYQLGKRDDGCELAAASTEDALIVIQRKGLSRVRYAGKEGKGFEELFWTGMSSNGSRAAWIGRYRRKQNYTVFVDNELIGGFVNIVDPVIFSPSGEHYMFSVIKSGLGGEQLAVVLDGKARSYTNISRGLLDLFSPDGSRTVYGVTKGKHRYLVIDGELSAPYDRTGWGPVFSADSRRVGFVGTRHDTAYAVIDGVEYGGFTDIGGLVCSPDGAEFAYYADSNYTRMLIRGDRRYGPHRWIGGLTYSPDGSRFAYLAQRDGDTLIYAVIDSVWTKGYPGIVNFTFSSNGSDHAFVAIYDGSDGNPRQGVVQNGIAHPIYDYVYPSTLQFAPDGRLAYLAEIDTLRVVAVIDGLVSPEYRSAYGPWFPENGAGVCYLAEVEEGEWSVVRDGVPERQLHNISKPVYSPDGQDLAYFGTRAGDVQLIINNAPVGLLYDIVAPKSPHFNEAGEIMFFGQVGLTKIERVVVRPN